jgi:hypothetical protein
MNELKREPCKKRICKREPREENWSLIPHSSVACRLPHSLGPLSDFHFNTLLLSMIDSLIAAPNAVSRRILMISPDSSKQEQEYG